MLSPLPLLAKGLGTGWSSTCGSGARFTLCKGWKPPAGTELALLGAFLIFCLLHSFTTVSETCCIAGKKPCNFIASESVSSQLFSRGGGQSVKRQSSSRALSVGNLRPNGTSQGVALVWVSQDAQLINRCQWHRVPEQRERSLLLWRVPARGTEQTLPLPVCWRAPVPRLSCVYWVLQAGSEVYGFV